LKRATTITKIKVAKVSAELKTIGIADVNATMSVLLEWWTQRFIRTMSCKVIT